MRKNAFYALYDFFLSDFVSYQWFLFQIFLQNCKCHKYLLPFVCVRMAALMLLEGLSNDSFRGEQKNHSCLVPDYSCFMCCFRSPRNLYEQIKCSFVCSHLLGQHLQIQGLKTLLHTKICSIQTVCCGYRSHTGRLTICNVNTDCLC